MTGWRISKSRAQMSDVAALANMTGLVYLQTRPRIDQHHRQLQPVSPKIRHFESVWKSDKGIPPALSDGADLWYPRFEGNPISDIAPLSSLAGWGKLHISRGGHQCWKTNNAAECSSDRDISVGTNKQPTHRLYTIWTWSSWNAININNCLAMSFLGEEGQCNQINGIRMVLKISAKK